jgi:short-subunit dehydrogenase
MWQQSFETDLWSVIHGCRILLPLLVDSGGGHLVNVASAAGLLGPPDLASYGVAKAGVISLSESLAVELVEEKIDVTVSCPTVFRSHLLDEEGHDSETMQGATFDGLQHEMETTSISSEDIAASLVEAMAKRRMYSVPQRDARVQWWLSRTFPESFRKLLVYLYRNKKWVFKTD